MKHAIPLELRELRQWVCANEDKRPINPVTLDYADVTNPATWGTFEQALYWQTDHVGFVLSKTDPYTIIDLDDPHTKKVNGVTLPETNQEIVDTNIKRHQKILEASKGTYAELSQSGQGIHIICRGKIPKGCRRDKVEVYSDSRYMICTGNIYNNVAITDQQTLLDKLFAEMGQERAEAELVQVQGTLTDDEICRMAYNAVNGEKFYMLWQGHWQGHPLYPSQSEADFALLSIIAFYTKDNEQVRRIFRQSALGQRDKAKRNDKYLNYALRKIRSHELPTIDVTELLAKHEKENQPQHIGSTGPGDNNTAPQTSQPSGCETDLPLVNNDRETGEEDKGAREKVVTFPPGFVGELAQYFYDTSVYPLREISLVAAMGWTAGIIGRCFQVSNTGLNFFMLIVARSGVGKDVIHSCPNKFFDLLAGNGMEFPNITSLRGPSEFASGQALQRHLQKNPCFLSVLGEFEVQLEKMMNDKSSSSEKLLRKVMLDVYAASNRTSGSVAYSDNEKTIAPTIRPCPTFIGDCTPDIFDILDFKQITSGFLSRWSIVEYRGKKPSYNTNSFCQPSESLLNKAKNLLAISFQLNHRNAFEHATFAPEALAMFDEFRKLADNKYNNGAGVESSLWSRAHLKAMKFAALLACSTRPDTRVINKEEAAWAINFVEKEIQFLTNRFSKSEFGTGESRRESDILRAMETWLGMSEQKRRLYESEDNNVKIPAVPFRYIYNRVKNLKSFESEASCSRTVRGILQNLTQMGVLQMVTNMNDWYAKGRQWRMETDGSITYVSSMS